MPTANENVIVIGALDIVSRIDNHYAAFLPMQISLKEIQKIALLVTTNKPKRNPEDCFASHNPYTQTRTFYAIILVIYSYRIRFRLQSCVKNDWKQNNSTA